ncbi:PD-(D/E)XK nuclease family protein [Xanthobacter oligotrophicus]|uniref:PDDEXK-like family protein n=1 Tax=Xanthobacter oligotrophicus TaxID=2607286 RepID=UPI00165E7314|nr:PD-(D/E)XK nuclease family protein [Xanthobacter oligotrophicus]MCG5235546.1 PD-(D/E)XK nuclease family protein [Xanthobacter oligotrophicus]
MTRIDPIQTAHQLLSEVAACRTVVEAARRQYEDRLAPDFSPLQFLWLDELMWSRLMAWLLNPRETHAQKGRFLHLFVRNLVPGAGLWSEKDCDQARVEIEHSFSDGRIDIVVECGERFLVIENKPYAADQDRQLQRYFTYADQLSRAHLKATIVYLTADGRLPSKHSLDHEVAEARQRDGTLVCLSYRDLALSPRPGEPAWLDACRLASRSPRVASFIEEIQAQIKAEFVGMRDMNQDDALVSLMSGRSDFIRSAFDVQRSLLEMKRELFKALVSDISNNEGAGLLKSEFRNDGFTLNFETASQIPFIVRVQAFDMMAIGLMRREEKNSQDPMRIAEGRAYASRLTGLVASEKWGDDLWAWVFLPNVGNDLCPLPADFWANPEPWVQVAERERGHRGPETDVAGKILAAVHRIRDALGTAPAEPVLLPSAPMAKP